MNLSLDANRPSVAIIGDSFVEGYCLPYKKSFAYLLGDLVKDKQIINLGVNGYSPDQYLLYSRRHLKNFNVKDIIVAFFPYNDIPMVFRKYTESQKLGYSKPYFEENNFDTLQIFRWKKSREK